METRQEVINFPGSGDTAWNVILTPDNQQFITGLYDKSIKIYTFQSKPIDTSLYFPQEISGATHFDDLLLLRCGKNIILWSLPLNREVGVLTGHTDFVCDVKATRDNVLSGSVDCSIILWSWRTDRKYAGSWDIRIEWRRWRYSQTENGLSQPPWEGNEAMES